MAGKRVEIGSVAWKAGATRWSFASCHFNENFCCVALSGLATCNGLWHLQRATATATRRQQGWQWRWRWQLESGNQPCYGSLAVPHPAPSVHLSLSLSIPASICRGPVQRLRLRLRQMATATGITALRCTWNSCCCSCCCCCCHPFVLLLPLFDSNRIICLVCIRSLISRI